MKPKLEFHFARCAYEVRDAVLELEYRAGEHRFCEHIRFADAPAPVTERAPALQRCLQLLHLAAGVSYYKALLPGRLCAELPLGPQSAVFFNDFYRKGLAEFAWRNRLDPGQWPHFRATGAEPAPARHLPLQRRTLLPFGGGQGSAVSLEALRAIGEQPTALVVNSHPATERMARAAGVPLLRVERRLDPQLLELNRQGARNGHVPITGILSFVFVFAALLYDFDTVILSNERSADEGNFPGRETGPNHQWSKSAEFERGFSTLLQREICPSLRYFSLLRPYHELRVAQLFAGARFAAYRPLFLSCNRAFRGNGRGAEHWCANCDKCRFMFLALAPFLPRAELQRIFGAELLHADSLSDYEKLLGLRGEKPFDCVGTVGECRAALRSWAQHPDWCGHPQLAQLLRQVEQAPESTPGEELGEYLGSDNAELLPPAYRGALDAIAGPG